MRSRSEESNSPPAQLPTSAGEAALGSAALAARATFSPTLCVVCALHNLNSCLTQLLSWLQRTVVPSAGEVLPALPSPVPKQHMCFFVSSLSLLKFTVVKDGFA
jgi:hypothetical protein